MNHIYPKPIISIIGPTAVGKTSLSIKLANKINGEIIGLDSRQIYKGMSIGTAQPTKEELNLIPHHLIGIKDPNFIISSGQYADLVIKTVLNIINRKKEPLICGGAGLYYRAISKGIFSGSKTDLIIRSILSDQYEEVSVKYRPAIGTMPIPKGTTDPDQWANCLLEAKERLQKKEIETGTTQVGPHRDDVEIRIGNLPAGAFASRAQLRTAALSLRLAESNYLRQNTGDEPVILLDDVLSELDAQRRESVIEHLKNFPQTIITTTNEEHLQTLRTFANKEFKVSKGKIS